MKKIIVYIMLLLTLLMPLNVNAGIKDDYKTLGLVDTLKEEELELSDETYTESDKKINIYVFRGKGCSYCHKLISFINSITPEYGKYFNLVSFEVWNDTNNSSLMKSVAKFMDEDASGVPFTVIGDKAFVGYIDSYDDSIKKAITELYNAEDKYDVFTEMEKSDSSLEASLEKINTKISDSSNTLMSWMIVLTVINIGAMLIKTHMDKKQVLEVIRKKK